MKLIAVHKLINLTKNLLIRHKLLLGCLLMGFCWHFSDKLRDNLKLKYLAISLVTALISWLVFQLIKYLYHKIINKLQLSDFWQKEFARALDALFFIFTLLFIFLILHFGLLKLIYITLIIGILFVYLQRIFGYHRQSGDKWRLVNYKTFIFSYFIFFFTLIFQFIAYKMYLLNDELRVSTSLFLRAWAITMFWLLGFAVSGLIYTSSQKKWRYLGLIIWTIFFSAVTVVLTINSGVLYFSGLYFNPTALFHIQGAGAVIFNTMPLYIMIPVLVIPVALIIFMVRRLIRSADQAPTRYWRAYSWLALFLAIVSLIAAHASITRTPEFVITKSFYQYWHGDTKEIKMDDGLRQKLERFGLFYRPNDFYVAHKEKIFSTTTSFLPEKLRQQKPNIIIISLESFSSRLSDVYNPRFKDLTPGLERMADNKNTTIFKNFYNASTPTITGLMAQMCSFLPPTGHEEINNKGNLQKSYLLCLPQILEKYAGYKYSAYITAVEKNYAGKDSMFESMGINEVYGTEEVAKIIKAPSQSSWGYSDHQLFPATWQIIQTKAKNPFLVVFSTVDTHQPFNLAKDMIRYGDGKSNLLNSIHTTDDAFGKFWDGFINSPLAENTIFIAVADHAVFPMAYDAKTFPEENKLTAKNKISFYDENFFLMYIPDSILPKEINTYSSSIDLTPSVLNLLNINVPNAFDGHSIFDDRPLYPDLLGMHELGLYINQLNGPGGRTTNYTIPSSLECPEYTSTTDINAPLSECEYLHFYKWKRQMMEEGRLWER
ncbi:MAG: LTA synthase family protein [Patescibacteria group bacterium]